MFARLNGLSSKGSLKSRLLSFRDRFIELETNSIAVTNTGKKISFEQIGCKLAVEELRDEIRRTLKELMRMMRSESGCFLNPDVDDVGSAQIDDDVERDYVMLWAAFLGRSDALQRLRADGAHLNAEHPTERYNALHLAALSGNLECVRWLLNEGCPIHYTAGGLSPLHFAAFGGSLNVCQFLIRNQCPIDSTALHAAVYSGSIDCAQFLLADHRVLLRAFDDAGLTALHVAADLGNSQMIELLLDNGERVDVNAKTRTASSYTALHTAAEAGYVDCMRSLLRAGANANARSAHRRTPLHLACKLAFVDCAQLLLEYNADVNAQDEDGRTPLHVSVSKSPWSMPLVRLLVEHEANVNVSDSFGYTVLHVAALNELEQCVEYLILNGANVAARTVGNITALNIINRKTPVSVKTIPVRLSQFLSYKEQNLKLNFRDIIHNSTVGEIGYLYTLQKEGQENVLVHPLIQAFLHRKWEKVKYYIVFRVIFSILSAILLSSYVLMCITKGVVIAVPFKQLLDVCGNETTVGDCITQKCNISPSINVRDCVVNITDLSDQYFIEECCLADCKTDKTVTFKFRKQVGHQRLIERCWCSTLLNCADADSLDEYNSCVRDPFCNFLLENPPVIVFLWRLINLFIGLNAVRIGFSTAGYKSAKHYLSYYVNILELFVTFSTVTLSFIDQDSVEIRLPIGACAVLSYWAFLMITVGHLPFFGTHIAMFLKVLREFLRMIGAFFCLLIGFTFTFCVLKPKRFQSPLSGFIQIIGMMTGELNTDEIIQADMGATPVAKSTLEYTLMLVLWLFMFLVTIVLMNLLVGIAVNDVEGLRKTADLCELIQQTKLIYFIELCCFRGYFPNQMVKYLRNWLYTSPDSYKVVMYVRPLNPHEKRLPKDIMDAAVAMAVERTNSRYKKDNSNKTVALDKRVENMEIEIKKLVELVCKLNKNIDLLTVTGEKPNNDPWSVSEESK